MIRSLLPLGVLAAMAALAPAAHATSFSASGGDGSLGLHAETALLPMLHANLDYLRTGDDRGDAKVYAVGLMISPPTPLVDWAVGARYQYQDTRWGRGGGPELGASVFVDTPIPLLSAGGYGFCMPAGAAHGRIRRSCDVGAQLRLGFTGSFHAWVGYRYLRSTFRDTGAHVLYKGPSLGLGVGF